MHMCNLSEPILLHLSLNPLFYDTVRCSVGDNSHPRLALPRSPPPPASILECVFIQLMGKLTHILGILSSSSQDPAPVSIVALQHLVRAQL